MKKVYSQILAFAGILLFASCTDINVVTKDTDSNADTSRMMTFTATHENNDAATRAMLNGMTILWESGDKIKVYNGSSTNEYTVSNADAGSSTGHFTGPSSEAMPTSYTAVYPSTAASAVSDGSATVTLPPTQTATDGSFDKAAALMMAKTTSTDLKFKNALAYIAVTPNFDCEQIVIRSRNSTVPLAGTGTLSYNNGSPSINITSNMYFGIKLSGSIKAGKTYYFAVPTLNLAADQWFISFFDSNNNVFTRLGNKALNLTRNTITDIGSFDSDATYWNEDGIVTPDQKVDINMMLDMNGKRYHVIFAKSNLTQTGLANNEYDYGDYFAWGATEPWYQSVTQNANSISSINNWKSGKETGYAIGTAPYYTGTSYSKYNSSDGLTYLKKIDDAAANIIGGEWQIPSKEVWQELIRQNGTNDIYTREWQSNYSNNISGYKVTKSTETSLFLPVTGNIINSAWDNKREAHYLSNTGSLNEKNYRLYVSGNIFNPNDNNNRFPGLPIRPVRMIETSLENQWPVGYTRLSYIENNGDNTAPIDTKLIISDDTWGARIIVQYTDITQADKYPYGTLTWKKDMTGIDYDTRFYGMGFVKTGSLTPNQWQCGWSQTMINYDKKTEHTFDKAYEFEQNYKNDHKVKMRVSGTDTWEYFNSSKKSGENTSQEGDIDLSNSRYEFKKPFNSLYIFGIYKSTGTDSWKGRIYDLVLSIGDKDAYHFVPAKKDDSNAVGFYDIINGHFYEYQGGIGVE